LVSSALSILVPGRSKGWCSRVPESPLAPREVAGELFGFRLDRDTRSPQLAMEAFLTLAANGYADCDENSLRTPKRGNLSLRSLAIGTNFHAGSDSMMSNGELLSVIGETLAAGIDLPGFTNLHLAADSLAAVIDHETTRQADKGRWLLYPFHESLLWYDARPQRAAGTWSVRQVVMRGTGITVASMLSDPSLPQSPAVLEGIREALTAPSRFAQLHDALPDVELDHREAEENEKRDWNVGRGEQVRPISEPLVRHSASTCSQLRLSPAARLSQLRAMFALDIAIGALRIAWERSETPERQRYLLLACQPIGERRRDFVRQYSEESWNAARRRLAEATVRTLGELFAAQPENTEWEKAIGIRGEAQSDRMKPVLKILKDNPSGAAYARAAELAFEAMDYSRAADGVRVLLESLELVAGPPAYRYLRPRPPLLGALVGALWDEMPMPLPDFTRRVYEEWSLLISEHDASGTDAAEFIEGADLVVNERGLEALLTDAGLALALSDQTCLVGHQRELQR
jgi:hypothetical protein